MTQREDNARFISAVLAQVGSGRLRPVQSKVKRSFQSKTKRHATVAAFKASRRTKMVLPDPVRPRTSLCAASSINTWSCYSSGAGQPGEVAPIKRGTVAEKLEPVVGFEPTTDGLQNRCSTTELNWRHEAAS